MEDFSRSCFRSAKRVWGLVNGHVVVIVDFTVENDLQMNKVSPVIGC